MLTLQQIHLLENCIAFLELDRLNGHAMDGCHRVTEGKTAINPGYTGGGSS